MTDKFNPAEHLRSLKRRRKVKENGQESWVVEEHQYLDVKWRLVWFRQVYPEGYIETRELTVTDKLARIEAAVFDLDPAAGGKCLAKARRQVMAFDFKDFVEKCETQAIGRALALAGFGTQFCDDLDEDGTIGDSPIGNNKGSHQTDKAKSKQQQAKEIPLYEQIYKAAESKGLSHDDTDLLLYFKYRKGNPSELTTEESAEFIEGVNNTSSERLQSFVKRLRANTGQEQVA
jgi:hypothetical protein